MGFERGIVEKNRALKGGGGGQKKNCGFKWESPKESSNFTVTEFVITQTAYKKCQKPAFLTTRGGVTLVCAKQVCEQGIEMDGFCVRQGQAMKAPIAHTYTNCVPRLPLYLI